MEQLKRLREARGLSQVKLAARADVNPATVNQIEGGKRTASPATLHKLAGALDVSLYELLEGEPHPKASAPPEPSFNDILGDERREHVYRFDSEGEPRIPLEQLREYGIEASDSEVIVLNQYLQVHEHPPSGPYATGHVAKEDEPVDHERVKTLLAFVLASDMLTHEETWMVRETLHAELVGAKG